MLSLPCSAVDSYAKNRKIRSFSAEQCFFGVLGVLKSSIDVLETVEIFKTSCLAKMHVLCVRDTKCPARLGVRFACETRY
jgi:hypothetical protein